MKLNGIMKENKGIKERKKSGKGVTEKREEGEIHKN